MRRGGGRADFIFSGGNLRQKISYLFSRRFYVWIVVSGLMFYINICLLDYLGNYDDLVRGLFIDGFDWGVFFYGLMDEEMIF